MFKRTSYLKKSSSTNLSTPSASTSPKSDGDGPSLINASSQSTAVGPSFSTNSGGFLSRVRQAGSRSGAGGSNQKLSSSSLFPQPARQTTTNPIERNGKNVSSPVMPSLFRINSLPGVSSARPSFDNSSVSSFSSVSTSSSLHRDRERGQGENGHDNPHDIWDHDRGENDIRVPLFKDTGHSSASSSFKERPRAAAGETGTGHQKAGRLIDIEPLESEQAPLTAGLSIVPSSTPQTSEHLNGLHSLPNGSNLIEREKEKDLVGMFSNSAQAVASPLPQSTVESPVPISPTASHPAPVIKVDTPPEPRKNNPFENLLSKSTAPLETDVVAATSTAVSEFPSSKASLSPPRAAPSSSNGDSADSISKHHHHHVHRSEGHTHSPPAPSYPPVRAVTLSGMADVAALADSHGVGKKRFMNGKSSGGFMSGLSRKFKDPKAEGALALASLPLPVPAPELSSQAKIDRAKQAERAHLLQICMELGVEIHDIAPDGNCLYGAIADQLYQLKKIKEDGNNPRTTRAAAADYMLAHPDSFMPFLVGVVDPNEQDDDKGATSDGMMTVKGFEKYCARVRNTTEWGGEPEILALSRYYQIPIHVIQSNHPKIVAHSPDPKARTTLDSKSARKIKAVRISYHRRLYGLGEHYNSLRKITYQISSFSAMVPM